jgi:hypothetical protein
MAFLAPVAGAVGGASGGISMLGSVLSGVGTLIGAMGSMQMANYQAAVAERNAQIADENAKTQRQIGQIDQQEQDFEAAMVLSQERAKQAGSGFQLNSTAFQRRNTTLRMLARRDALRVRDDAERKAVAFENEAQGELESARMSKMAGRNSMLQGVLSFGTSLISGASQVNRIRANQISRGARAVSLPYA